MAITLAQITDGIKEFSDAYHYAPDFVRVQAQYLPQIEQEYLESAGFPFCDCLPFPRSPLWVPIEFDTDLNVPCVLGEYLSSDDGSESVGVVLFSPNMTTRNMEAQQA